MMLSQLERDAIRWATDLGINERTGIRMETIVKLYQRYGNETDVEFVKKMCSSKTAINDTERTYHELLIKQNPDWIYEVNTPYGSVDFVDFDNREIIEVKDIRSWKQACSLLAYSQAFSWDFCLNAYAIFFGNINKLNLRNQIEDVLPWIGIDVGYIDENGTVERVTKDGVFVKHREVTRAFPTITLEEFSKQHCSSRFNQMFGVQ